MSNSLVIGILEADNTEITSVKSTSTCVLTTS